MKDIIPIESINSLDIFVEGGLDDLLAQIETEATNFEPDLSTVKGRKQIASQAMKVAKSKVVIENARKDLVADWKAKAKVVDGAGKHARDFLDALKVRIRAPLTEWENAIKRKEMAQEHQAIVELCHEEALGMDDLFSREAEVKKKEADLEAKDAIRRQEEHEAHIATEAAQAEKDKAERKLLDAEQREIRLKKEAKAAEKQREQQKAAAVKAERDRLEREQAEKARISREKADAIARKDKARRDNLEHQRDINKRAFLELSKRLDDLFSVDSEPPKMDAIARQVVIVIARELIPGVRMVY